MLELQQLVQQNGYYEYFNVDSGQGLGTTNFSWSAALTLVQLFNECPSQVRKLT